MAKLSEYDEMIKNINFFNENACFRTDYLLKCHCVEILSKG